MRFPFAPVSVVLSALATAGLALHCSGGSSGVAPATSACMKSGAAKPPPAPAQQPLALAGAATVYYDPQITVMMSTYCTRCHVGDHDPSLGTYAEVKAAASTCLSDMQSGKMPQGGGMSAADVQTFQLWVQTGMAPGAAVSATPIPNSADPPVGAPSNAAPDSSTPTKAALTYYGAAKAVLDKNCTSCHSPKGAQTPDLSTYVLAKAKGMDSIQSIQGGSMPPSGSSISSADLVKLVGWKDGGYVQGTPGSGAATTESDAGTTTSTASGCN